MWTVSHSSQHPDCPDLPGLVLLAPEPPSCKPAVSGWLCPPREAAEAGPCVEMPHSARGDITARSESLLGEQRPLSAVRTDTAITFEHKETALGGEAPLWKVPQWLSLPG